jgi:predicted  nucleic acid-binding Zn-ribbon protein
METILKYQELDTKLQQLEKKIESSSEKNVMNEMISYVKDAQNKSLKLEQKAKKMMEEYVALKKEYDKNVLTIKELTSKNSSELTTAQMDEIFNQINLVSSNLYMIERNLNIQLVNIKAILKEFETTKKGVINARTKHKESKEKHEALVNTVNPQIEAIKNEMLSLEKSIDSKLLTKYKSLKHDKVSLPIFVPVTAGNCGGCRMALPMGKLDKIKAEGYIICDQCGRVIFLK